MAVQAEDGTKVVGIRYPEDLLAEVRDKIVQEWMVDAAKETEKAALAAALAGLTGGTGGAGGAGAEVGGSDGGKQLLSPGGRARVRVEEPTPVNAQAAARALREPKTMMSFFQKKDVSGDGDSGGGGGGGVKREGNTGGDGGGSGGGGGGGAVAVAGAAKKAKVNPLGFAKQGSIDLTAPTGPALKGAAKAKAKGSSGVGGGGGGGGSGSAAKQAQVCPICAHSFPFTTLNSEVNAHMDKCIAETVL